MNPPRWGPLERHAMRQYCARRGVHILDDLVLDALIALFISLNILAPQEGDK